MNAGDVIHFKEYPRLVNNLVSEWIRCNSAVHVDNWINIHDETNKLFLEKTGVTRINHGHWNELVIEDVDKLVMWRLEHDV